MTTLDIGRRRRAATVGRPFYLVMSLLMAAVFVGGFATTVPGDFAPKPGLPLLLHLHGAVFTAWVLLFVAQPAFIARGSVALHRKIGVFGGVLAALMVVMGLAATVFSISAGRVMKFFDPGFFLVMNGLGILIFSALVGAGIVLRHRPEWHKRLMLIATVSILGPGLGRLLPMPMLGPAAPLIMDGVIMTFALAGPTADLIATRRVHPAYYWGVAAVILGMVAPIVLGATPPVVAAVHMITGV